MLEKIKNWLSFIRWDLLWEAFKLPARLLLMGLFSYGLSLLVTFIATKFNVQMSEETKEQLRVWFTTNVTLLFATIDKYLHVAGKDEELETGRKSRLTKGLTRF